ncbi:hypothetical protein AAFF_G00100660 [Aldrovandia affinis]|uniref:Uncharacterized protein n=1 Tax=Aldrovandia affinis TaxID=143900 RepID=A0AAD7WB67_9TELE|nr:hypothetical protein AAFF_G00100660 [Aldrovandia affinis]
MWSPCSRSAFHIPSLSGITDPPEPRPPAPDPDPAGVQPQTSGQVGSTCGRRSSSWTEPLSAAWAGNAGRAVLEQTAPVAKTRRWSGGFSGCVGL